MICITFALTIFCYKIIKFDISVKQIQFSLANPNDKSRFCCDQQKSELNEKAQTKGGKTFSNFCFSSLQNLPRTNKPSSDTFADSKLLVSSQCTQ